MSLFLHPGPDTSDLGLRVGLHSGPITGGVLRGDRARFQLFGDTMVRREYVVALVIIMDFSPPRPLVFHETEYYRSCADVGTS